MPALLIVLDGASDRPVKPRGATPLHDAHKPTIDRLTEEGSCGMLDPIAPGVRPGSDTSHLALFGYDPLKYYTGRGPLEALGAGIELGPGDVAFRANAATVDEDLVVVDRRAGRRVSSEEARAIEEVVSNEVVPLLERRYGLRLLYKQTVEHRGVLVVREANTSSVTDTDPHKVGAKVLKCRPLDESAQTLASLVNEFTELVHKALKRHSVGSSRSPPINMILLRGPGLMPKIEPLPLKYRMRGAAIAGVALIRGVAKAVGMDVYIADGLLGTAQDRYEPGVRLSVDLLKKYDLVFLHVKGTDSAAHDGNYELKVKVIEEFDRALGTVIDAVGQDVYIVITSDHTTPVNVGDHTGEPTPIAIYGPDVVKDDVSKLSELTCWRGALGRIRGIDLMNILGSYMGLTEKFGE